MKKDNPMEINYLIAAHKNPLQVKRLVNALEGDFTHFYIHIDVNSDVHPFRQQFTSSSNVHFVEDEHRKATPWGDMGLTEANVVMLRQVIADKRGGYCVLLSGQDYPIKDKEYITHYFQRNYGINFIDTNPFPCSNWTNGGVHRISHYKFNLSPAREDFILLPSITSKEFYRIVTFKQILKAVLRGKNIFSPLLLKKRKFPPYLKPYGGENWWSLPIETVKKAISFIDEHPDYLEFHRHTLMAEEFFFPSIVAHLFSENPAAIKKTITYINWFRENVPLPVTFTTEDFSELEAAGVDYLFARKFDESVDQKIFDLLDQKLLIPKMA